MADVLKSIMNKITDDDPATRGQQLWVMFTLAIFLVAVLNYYAMIREPDIIEMKDLIEYKNVSRLKVKSSHGERTPGIQVTGKLT